MYQAAQHPQRLHDQPGLLQRLTDSSRFGRLPGLDLARGERPQQGTLRDRPAEQQDTAIEDNACKGAADAHPSQARVGLTASDKVRKLKKVICRRRHRRYRPGAAVRPDMRHPRVLPRYLHRPGRHNCATSTYLHCGAIGATQITTPSFITIGNGRIRAQSSLLTFPVPTAGRSGVRRVLSALGRKVDTTETAGTKGPITVRLPRPQDSPLGWNRSRGRASWPARPRTGHPSQANDRGVHDCSVCIRPVLPARGNVDPRRCSSHRGRPRSQPSFPSHRNDCGQAGLGGGSIQAGITV